jgi:hypothetical protein
MNKHNFRLLVNKKLDEFVGRTDDVEIIKQDMEVMIRQLVKQYPQYFYCLEQIIEEGMKNGNNR